MTPSATSPWFLNISRDGHLTTSLGSLCQCIIPLSGRSYQASVLPSKHMPIRLSKEALATLPIRSCLVASRKKQTEGGHRTFFFSSVKMGLMYWEVQLGTRRCWWVKSEGRGQPQLYSKWGCWTGSTSRDPIPFAGVILHLSGIQASQHRGIWEEGKAASRSFHVTKENHCW